jgi:TolA-binding protein
MPYELSQIAVGADWRLMTIEYKALAVGAFVVVAVTMRNRIRFWRRMHRIENQLRKMEKKINILEVQESGRLMRLMKELNGKSRVKVDSHDTAAEADGGDIGLTRYPPNRETAESQTVAS